MRRIFLLTHDHLAMAVDEVLALTGSKPIMLSDGLLLVDTAVTGLAARLAYTRAVYRLLFRCGEGALSQEVGSVGWANVVKGSLAVRFPGDREMERKLASVILTKVKDQVVDLRSPDTLIEFFKAADDILCGILEAENPGGFEGRKSHKRKAPHPSSMHPKLCRWFVNRTGIRRGTVIDPFCGSGGILLEAGLMGLKVEGYDIEQDMISRAQENLSELKMGVSLTCQDALQIKGKLRFVATDLPYGRATKASPLMPLYDGCRDLIERQNRRANARIGGCARHSPHHA